MSHGKVETEKLKKNVEEQLTRLLKQLDDLEALKDDLDEDEYISTKEDTLQQMREFEASLRNMVLGNMTLVDELGALQLATQAAVSQAFKTPEVIRLFAKKQPGMLRQRLEGLKRDVALKRLSQATYTQQAVEILIALKKLGEKLNAEEMQFVVDNRTQALSDFETVKDDMGGAAKEGLLSTAGSQIKSAKS